MAFLPFTLIFLISLLQFHENMAKPYLGRAPDTWPQYCLGQNYCTDKPDDYPSESLLKKLYTNYNVFFRDHGRNATSETSKYYQRKKVDLPMPDEIETGHRIGSKLCKFHENTDPVYMIIDENDEARYTIQIPRVHEFNVTLRTCHHDQMLEDLADKIECKQTYTPLTFLVLSRDGTKMEIARVKQGLPTNCAPIFIE